MQVGVYSTGLGRYRDGPVSTRWKQSDKISPQEEQMRLLYIISFSSQSPTVSELNLGSSDTTTLGPWSFPWLGYRYLSSIGLNRASGLNVLTKWLGARQTKHICAGIAKLNRRLLVAKRRLYAVVSMLALLFRACSQHHRY